MTNLQAIDLLKGLEQSLDDYCELNDEGKTAFGMAITALELFGNTEQLPSAQQERKTGRWVERNPQNSPDCRLIECSECGNAYIVAYNIDYDDWIDGRDFCMRCGADLRGGSNGKST